MEKLVQKQTTAEYFQELVHKAFRRQKLETSELSAFYLVHLLDSFVRPDDTFAEMGVGEDPRLAELLCRASGSKGTRQQALFKMTGDLSLFISGFFSDSLIGKVVDADYYVKMGGYAYGRLASLTARKPVAEIFAELSERFVQFVDVLNEVSEVSALTDNRSILKLYEKWRRTGSRRSEELLRHEGVLLARGSDQVH